MENVQNLDHQSSGREVERESRNSQGGGKLEERGKGGIDDADKRDCNWQVNSIAEQEMPRGEAPVSSPATPPASSPAPAPASPPVTASSPDGPGSSLAEENSLDVINDDSQPYSIFYSELRQVIGC